MVIGRVIKYWRQRQIHRVFKGALLDNVVFGPELDKSFEVRHPQNLSMGYKTVISGDCFINAMGGVRIGKFCHIAKGLTIYSHNHNWKSEEYTPYDDTEIKKPVTIGDCVWIGANVTIAPGAEIENGVIISSGAVVFGHVPRCAIVRGNPAVVIGYRNKEIYDKLEKEGKFK